VNFSLCHGCSGSAEPLILAALAAAPLEKLRQQIADLVKRARDAAEEAGRRFVTALNGLAASLRPSAFVAALTAALAFLAALLASVLRAALTLEGALPVLVVPPPNDPQQPWPDGNMPPLAQAPTDLKVGPVLVMGLTGEGCGPFLASYADAFYRLARTTLISKTKMA
jgi:hypothetical protein